MLSAKYGSRRRNAVAERTIGLGRVIDVVVDRLDLVGQREGGEVVECIGPTLGDRPLVGRVDRVGVLREGVERGDDGLERGFVELAVDHTTTEEPRHDVHAMVRRGTQGTLLVDEVGPHPHGVRELVVAGGDW